MSDESANPDTEIPAAVRPGLATTRGPLIIASSPYAKRGVLWDTYKQHYGKDGDPLILVAQGASRDFNPALPQAFVDRELEKDRAGNPAEYLARVSRRCGGIRQLGGGHQRVWATTQSSILARRKLFRIRGPFRRQQLTRSRWQSATATGHVMT